MRMLAGLWGVWLDRIDLFDVIGYFPSYSYLLIFSTPMEINLF